MKTHTYPPGFEGEPRYKRNTLKESQAIPTSQAMPSYSAIQHTCAKKLNIFLPAIGYSHIVLEEDDIDKIYEMAYRNEFRLKAATVAPTATAAPTTPSVVLGKKAITCRRPTGYSNCL